MTVSIVASDEEQAQSIGAVVEKAIDEKCGKMQAGGAVLQMRKVDEVTARGDSGWLLNRQQSALDRLVLFQINYSLFAKNTTDILQGAQRTYYNLLISQNPEKAEADSVKKNVAGTAVKYADKLVFFVDIEALLDDKNYMLYKKNTATLLTRFKTNNMLPLDSELYVAFNKADMVEKKALEVSKSEEDGIGEKKKKAFIKNWKTRRASILEVIREIVNIPDEHIFDICSKGIQRDAEDKGLIDLLAKLLDKPKKKTLSVDYNWIQGLLKS